MYVDSAPFSLDLPRPIIILMSVDMRDTAPPGLATVQDTLTFTHTVRL